MAHTVESCEARASEAAAEASSTQLENVRERALRSEAAWRLIASRLLDVQRERETIKVERALREQT